MWFGVLGPTAARTDEGVPVVIPEAKVRLLLADLLSHDGRPVPVDRLVEDLWGSTPPANPAAVLRTKVSQLRRAFEDAEPGGRGLVVWRPPGYLLRVEQVDARRFAELTRTGRASQDIAERAALLAQALELWRGPAFADVADAPFLTSAIAKLEEDRLVVTEEYAEAELALGRYEHLAGLLAELVGRHPLRERLRAAYLRVLYQAGRQSEALASYHELRARLGDELGVDPAPELAALYQAILEHDPGLAPVRSVSGAVPAPLTEIIGRGQDIAAVTALLGTTRLVTLTGAGGVGKTRLAVAVAERVASPVRMVELDQSVDVAEDVAAALGVGAVAAGPPVPVADRIVAAVRDRAMVLVLDNVEHVVGAVAELVARILAAAPDLRVLATSREPLGIAGEHVFAVAPLASADAAALFVARARAAGGEVHDADAVAVICRELDGLPLALELAAARVRALGVPEVARRLGERFALLTTGGRGRPERQRTLRAVIDWSWELLSEPERVVLSRLAVFAGGCTLEAAEAVCGDGAVVGRLVDRSLVSVVGGRYVLSRSVAAYCAEKLVERAEVERRHDEYFTALAERADPLLRGPEQLHWLLLLDAETANLRAAVRRVPRLANALAWYWLLRGRLAEAHRSLAPGPVRDAFAVVVGQPVQHTGGASARERWLLGASLFGADPAESARLTTAALTEFHATGDAWGVAAARNTMAWHALARDDYPEADRAAAASLAAFEELGDQWGQMVATENLASVASSTGDHGRAIELFERGIELAERLGFHTEIPFQLCGLAGTHLAAGRPGLAEEIYTRAAELAAKRSVRLAETYARQGLEEVRQFC